MSEFRYEIGDRVFYQKPLVLGQVKQLIGVMKGLVIPNDFSVAGIVMALGDKISQAIAILLVEENVPLKKKKVNEIQDLIEENFSIEQTLKVIEDFFDCNPIALISEAMIGLTTKVQTSMTQATSLTESLQSLPEETLQKEMTSLGDTPLENVNPI